MDRVGEVGHAMPMIVWLGWELRCDLEPEERGDLLHTEVHKSDVVVLEAKARALRELLRDQGWDDRPDEGHFR